MKHAPATAAELEAFLVPIRDEYPFQPRAFEHPDGVRQGFIDEGPRVRDGLVFVHGNPTWSFLWRNAIRRLAPRRRCVAVDHVGCGLSQKPQRYPYTLEQHVENLERLLLSLELERITLVVHDWGGPIGLGFARRHPERVTRLVITNSAAFPSTRIPLRIAACRIPLFGALAVRGLNAFARAATFMAVERPLAREVKRGFLLPYDSWDHRVAIHAFVADIPMDEGHPSWNELAAVEASLAGFADRPILLVWGERDWCFTPWFREEWQRRFPEARLERCENAGHFVLEDAGALAALERFLDGTDPAMERDDAGFASTSVLASRRTNEESPLAPR